MYSSLQVRLAEMPYAAKSARSMDIRIAHLERARSGGGRSSALNIVSMPSFAAFGTVSRRYSPSANNVGAHVDRRPAYTTIVLHFINSDVCLGFCFRPCRHPLTCCRPPQLCLISTSHPAPSGAKVRGAISINFAHHPSVHHISCFGHLAAMRSTGPLPS
ncbi:hypothetical protein BGW80DRAFT_878854 [Lactifluus volemus]|nr:hypothetical protein BGW80DRAFT_878854 [Lactifluus volemus]